jgi:hypothetical protein
LRRAKIGEESLLVFKFSVAIQFLININIKTVFEGNVKKMPIYVETHWEMCPLIFGDLFGNCLMGIGDLWVQPKEYLKACQHCLQSSAKFLVKHK